MQEFFEFVKNVGFPIAITAYLLFRFERKLENAEQAITGKDGVIDKFDELKTIFIGKNGISDKIEVLIETINRQKRK